MSKRVLKENLKDMPEIILYLLIIVSIGLCASGMYHLMNPDDASGLRCDNDGYYSVLMREGEQTLRVKLQRKCAYDDEQD